MAKSMKIFPYTIVFNGEKYEDIFIHNCFLKKRRFIGGGGGGWREEGRGEGGQCGLVYKYLPPARFSSILKWL